MNNDLPDASLRVLARITEQMRHGYTGRIEVEFNDGGVSRYVEQTTIRPSDMAPVQPLTRRTAPF